MKPTNMLKSTTSLLALTLLLVASCTKPKDEFSDGLKISLDKLKIHFNYDSIHLAKIKPHQSPGAVALEIEKIAAEVDEILSEDKKIKTITYFVIIKSGNIYMRELRLFDSKNELVPIWDTPYPEGVRPSASVEVLNCEKTVVATRGCDLKDEIKSSVAESDLTGGATLEFKLVQTGGRAMLCVR